MSYLYLENNDGYIHRLVASKIIGRELKSNEVVHHIDENKNNNDPSNLMIFNSKQAHLSYHHGGKLIPLKDGTYDCESIRKRCLECNKILDYKNKSGYCKTHYSILTRKVKNRPSKELLLELLKNNSYSSIGKMYGVSNNAVKKWLN